MHKIDVKPHSEYNPCVELSAAKGNTMAFRTGDRVVYPGYGAGTIMAIEDKVFAGTTTRYYMLRMVADEGEFMVPVDQAEALGIRPVLDSKTIFAIIGAEPDELPDDYKERQAEIAELLATSDAPPMSKGARNLAWHAGRRQLTGRDIQLYEELQTRLASELSLAEKVTLEAARDHLREILNAITQQAEMASAEEADE